MRGGETGCPRSNRALPFSGKSAAAMTSSGPGRGQPLPAGLELADRCRAHGGFLERQLRFRGQPHRLAFSGQGDAAARRIWETRDQGGCRYAPVAQRGPAIREHVQAVVEGPACGRCPRPRCALQVPVGRGDGAARSTCRVRFPPRGLTSRPPRARSQPHLQAGDVSPTSSRNRVPPWACSNTRAVAVAPGEGPAHVAEQLGLEHALAKRAAVHGHERPRAARAVGWMARATSSLPVRSRRSPHRSVGRGGQGVCL
jgi:hypothetical protein